MQEQADEMRFVCRTRVTLLCRVLRSVSLLFFKVSLSLFYVKLFRSEKKDKKFEIQWVFVVGFDPKRKISKAPSFLRPWEKTVTPDRHSFVWFGTCARVVFLLLFFRSNALTKRRRRRGVSSRARSARARRRVDEEGVERG